MKVKNAKDSLGYDIARSNWYLKTLFNKLLREAGHPLTQEQWVILQITSVSPGVSQTELARRSLRDKTNITRILDGLQKKGFVVREMDTRDRRVYRIRCTRQGEEVLEVVRPLWATVEGIYSSALSQNEIDELRRLLDRLCSTVREQL